MSINYKIDAEVRWGVLTDQINKFTRDEKVQLILAAKNYQSGEGLMNTIYMGGMATASLCRAIGSRYGDGVPWAESLELASDKQIDEGIQVCMHTIEYMWSNPVGKCPICGQIISIVDTNNEDDKPSTE